MGAERRVAPPPARDAGGGWKLKSLAVINVLSELGSGVRVTELREGATRQKGDIEIRW